jgi:hypothetical protein
MKEANWTAVCEILGLKLNEPFKVHSTDDDFLSIIPYIYVFTRRGLQYECHQFKN